MLYKYLQPGFGDNISHLLDPNHETLLKSLAGQSRYLFILFHLFYLFFPFRFTSWSTNNFGLSLMCYHVMLYILFSQPYTTFYIWVHFKLSKSNKIWRGFAFEGMAFNGKFNNTGFRLITVQVACRRIEDLYFFPVNWPFPKVQSPCMETSLALFSLH